jgi:hypothetical protein
LKYTFLHDRLKRFARDVYEKLLNNRIATTGVSPSASGDEINASRRIFRGLFAVQSLQQCGDTFVRRIFTNTRIRRPGAMAQEVA